MAEEAEDLEDGEEGGGARKIILFVVLPLLLLIGAGVGVTVMLGVFDEPAPPPEEIAEGPAPTAEPEPSEQSAVFEVPDLIVNLNTSGRKSTFLKVKISLEIANAADIDEVNQKLPRIVDTFQVYLRELRMEDLQGSAGMERLRHELLRRVNIAVRPVPVRALLFKEMLVQ